MSLATRCSHCNTIFRVVQDQLKVSEGWVRCGRCQEVFNALDGLFDLEHSPPPRRSAPPPPPPPPPASASLPPGGEPRPASPEEMSGPVAHATGPDTVDPGPTAAGGPYAPPSAPLPDVPAFLLRHRGPTFGAAALAEGVSAMPAIAPPAGPDVSPAPMAPPGMAPSFAAEAVAEPGWGDPNADDPLFATASGDATISNAPLAETPPPHGTPAPDAAAEAQPLHLLDPELSAPRSLPPLDVDDLPSTQEDDALDSRWLMEPARDGRSASQRHGPQDSELDFADARFPVDVGDDDEDGEDTSDDAGDHAAPPPQGLRAAPPSSPTGAPGFVVQADRRARWHSPGVRATLGLVGLLLVGLLGVQVAVRFSDNLAARFPAAEPALAQLCAAAGCTIGPPHEIDQLAVESVAITGPITSGDQPTHTYRLQVTLRNLASFDVAMPDLELSLTDAQGLLSTRRVLSPGDLAAAESRVPASQSTTYTLLFQSPAAAVAGYSVVAFYR